MNAPAEGPAVPDGGRGVLRLLTCGSVDDGKSTLIGRLLYDSNLIPTDQFAALERDSKRVGTRGGEVDFALLLDGLEAERQQGITIDVAYRFFRTPRRAFIIADTPGHVQYTRNMVTGASTADVAIILADARKGVLPQTKRHARLCALMGIRHVVLAVNKLDLAGFAQEVFQAVERDFRVFAAPLDFRSIMAIPLCAVGGDNVVEGSRNMPWYRGPSLLAYLDGLDDAAERAPGPFRFPVQWVCRPDLDFRGFAGTVASGRVRAGDAVAVASSGVSTRVERIVAFEGDRAAAEAGEAVLLTLSDEVDLARGDILIRCDEADARPSTLDQFAAHVVWMGGEPLLPGRSYLVRMETQEVPGTVSSLRYKLDIDTHEHLAARSLDLNEIGFCHVSTAAPLTFDSYAQSRETASFILIDRATNDTVGAGMIAHPLRRADNLHRQAMSLDKTLRAGLKRQKPAILWFTGLSGAGKSTIANLVDQALHRRGVHTYLLDGDNIRLGINRDLGFTDADRVENIRRVGEIARLFVDAGLVVLCSFISPFAAERDMVRKLVGEGEFIEIFVDAPLALCKERDPKGLYRKAEAGEIPHFTGVTSPYEAPLRPEIVLKTDEASAQSLAETVVRWMNDNRLFA